MIGHLPDELFAEMAYLAWSVHWPHDELVAMTHHERRRWLREVERLAVQESEAAGRQSAPWH